MNEQDAIEAAIAGANPSSTGWYRVKCPFCLINTGKSDKKGSLAVSVTTGRYRCWKCETYGRIDLEYHGDFEIVEPSPEELQAPDGFIPLVDGNRWDRAISLQPAIEYLKSRLGKSAGPIARDLGIGACLTGKRQGRVVVPMKEQGKWVGWVGRDYTGGARLKYIYPKGMVRAFFNRPVLKSEMSYPYVMVVEGVFDALPYWPNVVACLGKPSAWQISELMGSNQTPVIALDGDAWETGWSLYQQLLFAGKRAGFVQLPPAQDPGSLDPGELKRLCFEAIAEDGPNFDNNAQE